MYSMYSLKAFRLHDFGFVWLWDPFSYAFSLCRMSLGPFPVLLDSGGSGKLRSRMRGMLNCGDALDDRLPRSCFTFAGAAASRAGEHHQSQEGYDKQQDNQEAPDVEAARCGEILYLCPDFIKNIMKFLFGVHPPS